MSIIYTKKPARDQGFFIYIDELSARVSHFTPFKERTALTNLGIIFSEVHQMFGRYNGRVILDDGSPSEIRDLIDFVEEHHARW